MDVSWIVAGGLLAVLLVSLGFLYVKTTGLAAERVTSATLRADAAQLDTLRVQLERSQSEILRLVQAKSELEGQCRRLPELDTELRDVRSRLMETDRELARVRAEGQEREAAYQLQIAAITALRDDVQATFKNVATDTLRESQNEFLRLANETFDKHTRAAQTDLSARHDAVGNLVAPVIDMLKTYQQQVSAFEKTQRESYGSLTSELRQVIELQQGVRGETAKLVNALQAAPKTRGRWGEKTLRNVIELSGLSAHCDFATQETFWQEGSSARPDLIINLPGGRTLVVDAKTALQSYLDAVEATDDMERERLLRQHATQIRNHAKQLGSKAYWEKLSSTPDFVVMFIPGDNFYAAAAERDPTLFEDAVAQKVLIATPATLICLAKGAAFDWRQEKVAENARRVHELGRDLYKRLATLGGHVLNVGKKLGDTVKGYNDFVGSLEGSVMPHARKFNELEVEGTTTTELPVLHPIEHQIRSLTDGRDIVVPPQLSDSAAHDDQDEEVGEARRVR